MFLSLCSDFRDRIPSALNAVVPEGQKIMGIQYGFSIMSDAHREPPDVQNLLIDIISCKFTLRIISLNCFIISTFRFCYKLLNLCPSFFLWGFASLKCSFYTQPCHLLCPHWSWNDSGRILGWCMSLIVQSVFIGLTYEGVHKVWLMWFAERLLLLLLVVCCCRVLFISISLVSILCCGPTCQVTT